MTNDGAAKFTPPEQVTLVPKMIASRKGCFGYKNPSEWKFSLVNICYILCHICDYIRWFFLHKRQPSPEKLQQHLPEADGAHLDKLKEPPAEGIQILWIGHATLLVQIEGYNIITDPVFGDFCGPNRWMGYTRFRSPPVTISDLKNKLGIDIHAVVVSHNHYDHLHEDSVQELVKFYGNMIQWFVPKGMKSWFEKRGCSSVTDMDWWEEEQMHSRPDDKASPLIVTFTPAKHWSARGLWNYYCRHLWGSWLIRGEKSVFYFAGDTGYADNVFPGIKKVAGQIDVAAIPIGAYKPRSVMKAQHVDPSEAVLIHKELGAKTSIGIHWGTFALSNEEIHEPVQDLIKAKEEENVNADEFIVMDHGEVKSFPVQQK